MSTFQGEAPPEPGSTCVGCCVVHVFAPVSGYRENDPPGRDPRWVHSEAGIWQLERAREQPPLATSAITAVFENLIDPLRRLIDEKGRNTAIVGFIHSQIEMIDAYLARGRTTTPEVRGRLMLANGQLNQLLEQLAPAVETWPSSGARRALDYSIGLRYSGA